MIRSRHLRDRSSPEGFLDSRKYLAPAPTGVKPVPHNHSIHKGPTPDANETTLTTLSTIHDHSAMK